MKDITVFAIGVGNYLSTNELNAIATDPDCKNVFYLNNFFEFDAMKEAIEKKTCEGKFSRFLLFMFFILKTISFLNGCG